MFTVEVVGTNAVIARMDRMPPAVHATLLVTIQRLALKLQAHVQRDKLQGQVLNHRTGRLSRSIQQRIESGLEFVLGYVFSAGDVKYARRHELGYDGEEVVKEHTRTMLFGKTVDPFLVPSFTRHAHTPERSFLRSSLRDMAVEIERDMKRAVVRGLNQAMGHAPPAGAT